MAGEENVWPLIAGAVRIPFVEFLLEGGACKSAVEWVQQDTKDQTFTEAWEMATREDWMVWLLMETQLVNCTCEQTGDKEECPMHIINGMSADEIRVAYPTAWVLERLPIIG